MKKSGDRHPIEHCTDGTVAKYDDVGHLIGIRGALGTAATAALVGGAPWWWPEHFPEAISVSTAPLLTGAAALSGALFIFGLRYLENRTVRSLAMKRQLHIIAHTIRDQRLRFWETGNLHPETMTAELAELIREYFSILFDDRKPLGIAIRIAVPDASGRTVYRTLGRAGLNQHRGPTSQDLSADSGVARVLRDTRGSQGVLIYHDIKAAVSAGAYVEQENDRKFPDDIKAFIVAPINGWDGERKAMLGLLYITSADPGRFKRKITDSVGFIADLLAAPYSELAIFSNPNFRGRQYALFGR